MYRVGFVTSRLGTHAANFCEGTLEPAEHLANGDLCRGPRELVAPFVAALASDDPYPAKIVEDRPQEANGKALGVSQLLSGEWFARPCGQGAQCPQRVLDSG
jgi:hypothetical protein